MLTFLIFYSYDLHDTIYGIKTVPDLETINIIAENVGGIPTSELIYSDSPERIIINGDLIFKSDVTISNDILLPPTGTVNGMNLRNDLFLVNTPFKGCIEDKIGIKISSNFFLGHANLESVTVDDARIVEVSSQNESIIIPAHFSLNDIQPENFEHIRIDNIIVENDLNADEINGVSFKELFSAPSNNVRFKNT